MVKSICIFNSNIGDILYNPDKSHVGGAELQQFFLAEELNRRGYPVSIVTFSTLDPNQKKMPFYMNREGIAICMIPKINRSRIKLLAHLRIIINIWLELRKINADVYLQGGAGYDTAFIRLFCFFYRKKFVVRLESMGDLVDNPDSKRSPIKICFSNFGISTANLVIALSNDQKKVYCNRWGQKCQVIKNVYPSQQNHQIIKTDPPVILWVGTIRPEWKRPEIFLKLAKSLPNARFQMVGGHSKDILFYQKIQQESKGIPNLEFVGFIPYTEIGNYFSKASIFVNTSSVEGFPNTFIEAWLSCMPVVSLEVDPDEVICQNNLGFHSKTFDQMVKDIEILLLNPDLRQQMGQNGQTYIKREHDVRKNIDKFIECLLLLE
jgi:glycosyltransferase involved in cell wall biosynthesis